MVLAIREPIPIISTPRPVVEPISTPRATSEVDTPTSSTDKTKIVKGVVAVGGLSGMQPCTCIPFLGLGAAAGVGAVEAAKQVGSSTMSTIGKVADPAQVPMELEHGFGKTVTWIIVVIVIVVIGVVLYRSENIETCPVVLTPIN